MLLGRPNSKLYLTFRGEGPASDLTSTQATWILKPVEERAWSLAGECSRLKLLCHKSVHLCVLKLGSLEN